MHEYSAIVRLIDDAGSSNVPPILRDIALLGSSRTPYAFDKRPFSGSVPSNALQRQSVLGLAHTVEGIQGPPGTGKSSTIFHIVNSAMPAGMVAVITCVQNRAVDALACKFQSSEQHTPFIVLGSPDRLGDTARKFALESRVETVAAVVLQRAVFEWAARVLVFLQLAFRKRGDEAHRRFMSAGWRRWWVLNAQKPLIPDLERWSARCEAEERALEEIRLAASASLASDAIVILCTVDALCRVEKLYYSSSRNSNNNNKKQNNNNRKPKPQQRFLLIIDEAGTVPEYKIPLAVSLGVEAVIAVGDQNQLQPFTHTGAANNGFFHRLARATSSSSSMIMLEEQFRMHPTISGFVSASFYGDRLITNPEVASARCSVPCSGLRWVDYGGVDASASSSSALLVPETPQQQQNTPTKTKHHHHHRTKTMIYNQTELDIVKTFFQDELPDLLSQGKTVMIITFYREQFHRLMLLGERLGLVGKRSRGEKEEEETAFFFTHPNFRISTVDASQGSESDVVVLSCVRCDPEKGIGFLSHPNRICVALSRAKERLVVVGNSKTLTAKSAVWGALYAQWCVGKDMAPPPALPFSPESKTGLSSTPPSLGSGA
jgi:hypothetical protein